MFLYYLFNKKINVRVIPNIDLCFYILHSIMRM